MMLFAKNAAAHRLLNEQFSSRKIKKTYLALVHGSLEVNDGTIDKPLRQFGSGRMGVDLRRGKKSNTSFRVEERLKHYTLVKVYPSTGRRHQIRVHFYSINHPIVGDLLYGDKAVQAQFPRLMLHAQEITFQLQSGQEITLAAPIPQSFKKVLNELI